MAVKVIKNRVFDGKKTYEVGDVISKLSAEDETDLVSNGVCEYVEKEKKSKDIQDDNIDKVI